MIALTSEEVLHWNEANAVQWRKFFATHPEALAIPCDIAGATTIGEVLQHIVAAQLRYYERLSSLPVTEYADISATSVDEIFAIHDRAMVLCRQLLNDAAYPWEEELDMVTRTVGTIIAPRKAVFFHATFHGIRHYAQITSVLRQNGLKTTWSQDYIMTVARRA